MSMRTDAVLSDIRTTDGKFYVGMTRDDISEKGKRTAKLFFELDEERDGVLSYDEIMKQRQQKRKNINITKNVLCGLGLVQVMSSPWSLAKAEQACAILSKTAYYKSATPKSYIASTLTQTLLFLGLALGKYLKMRKLQKQDEEYWAQYQEVLKSAQQDDKTKLEEKEKIDVTA